ncbi:hypothetical protein like AT3G51100 [Hibiscus trionum]|uniref:DUF8204 domain-containing protein n=1 Tax=Hibiscus trionum TaxID=183268 RepID=A0A9W7LJ31_HIBTR|nr:hypothetical protein like AT3G51100 [Hibiscus trionum]
MERSREEEKKHNLGKVKLKSCKGFLYYSSALKSQNRDPFCIGIPSSLPHAVKSNHVGLAETKAQKNPTGVEDFKFVCAGISVFMSKTEDSIRKDGAEPQLPHCQGLAYLRHLVTPPPPPPPPDPAAALAFIKSMQKMKETRNPTHHSVQDDFLNRFTRIANLIGSKVAKDMCRVGNNIKSKVEDILFSNRRPPK